MRNASPWLATALREVMLFGGGRAHTAPSPGGVAGAEVHELCARAGRVRDPADPKLACADGDIIDVQTPAPRTLTVSMTCTAAAESYLGCTATATQSLRLVLESPRSPLASVTRSGNFICCTYQHTKIRGLDVASRAVGHMVRQLRRLIGRKSTAYFRSES